MRPITIERGSTSDRAATSSRSGSFQSACASTKSIPCFALFAVDFSGSNSNNIEYRNYTTSGNNDRKVAGTASLRHVSEQLGGSFRAACQLRERRPARLASQRTLTLADGTQDAVDRFARIRVDPSAGTLLRGAAQWHAAQWQLTAARNRRRVLLFVCGGVVRHIPPSVPGPWRRSPLGALRARESGTPTRSGVGSLGSTAPLVRIDLRIIRPARRSTRERSPDANSPSGQSRWVGDDRQDRNSQRQRHHARVPPQESPSYRAAGAWRVVVTTSRHVPHSAAPQARRPTVRAVIDREAARRQARRDDARPQRPYRPRVQAAPFSGRSGQPRVDSTTRTSLLVNAGLSCVDEGDHGTGRGLEGERERAMSPVARVIGRMSMDTPTRRCSRSFACWHVRRRVKSSHKPPWSRTIRSKRAANESRHLRPVLVREPTRRVDR